MPGGPKAGLPGIARVSQASGLRFARVGQAPGQTTRGSTGNIGTVRPVTGIDAWNPSSGSAFQQAVAAMVPVMSHC